jgi:ATP-dependent Clp protease ATP-binding subunit ClpB
LLQERLFNVSDEQIEVVMGELREQLGDMLRQSIRPEFLNRIDEIVLFKPLSHKEIRQIVEIQLNRVAEMLKSRDIKLVFNDETKDWLVNVGYDVTFGARPLKRTIQKYVANPLAQELLAGNFGDGDTIKISVGEKGKLAFRK